MWMKCAPCNIILTSCSGISHSGLFVQIFMKPDFALEDPATFNTVLPWSHFNSAGGKSSRDVASSKLLQEKVKSLIHSAERTDHMSRKDAPLPQQRLNSDRRNVFMCALISRCMSLPSAESLPGCGGGEHRSADLSALRGIFSCHVLTARAAGPATGDAAGRGRPAGPDSCHRPGHVPGASTGPP